MPRRKKAKRTQPKKAASPKPRARKRDNPKQTKAFSRGRRRAAAPRKKPQIQSTRKASTSKASPKKTRAAVPEAIARGPALSAAGEEEIALRADRVRAQTAEKRLRETQERLRDALSRLDLQIREIAALQTSFLPTGFPPVGGLAFGALCRPCAEVAGDYYDVFTMHDGRVCITIADVTGHGARAAVLMAMTRSLTRAAAAMTAPHHGPGWILNRINEWLRDQLTETQFVTMWLGLWDPSRTELRFSRAGHPAGILCRAGKPPEPLVADGVPPLGMITYPSSPPENHIPLGDSDRLILYTDGWTESNSADGRMLGEAGMIEALREEEGLVLESLPLALYFRLERFVANSALTDDVSLLILERRAGMESAAP